MPKQKALPVNQAQSRAVAFYFRNEDGDSIFNESNRTLELSFSSETAVERWFGKEVLRHSPGSIRHGTRQTSMPLLYNHNRDDVIGVVESIWVEDSRGHARVRFAKNARGNEILDLVRDGILTNVSFAYRVYDYQEMGDDMYIARDWEPFEISIVTVPADASVGIGRSLEEGASEPDAKSAGVPAISLEKKTMPNPNENHINVDQVRESAAVAERSRISEITAMCTAHGIDASKRDGWITAGTGVDEVRAAVLESIQTRNAKPVAAAKPAIDQKDLAGYSLVRAIRASVTRDWSKAGLEREVSKELGRSIGRETEGFFMPTALRDHASQHTVGTPADGGNLVATNLLAGNFIDLLRNKSCVMELGATILSGLVGDVAIPRQNGATSTYWVGEDGAPSPSKASFDQLTLSPKTIGAITSISRKLLLQSSPAIEMLVRNDLAKVLALGIDLAVLAGTGTGNQPKGIVNTDGIGKVTLTGSYDDIIDLETKVAIANADVAGMAYVANAAMVGTLKKMKDKNDNPVWYQQPGSTSGTPGQINGYRVCRTNQCPADTIIFGNFADVVIGEWGAIEILPNAYGDGYASGAIELRALQSLDIGLRHAESFAVASGS